MEKKHAREPKRQPRPTPLPPTLDKDVLVDMESELLSCARAGEVPRALSLLEELKEAGVETRKHFMLALQACATSGQYEDASGLLYQLEKARLGPDHDAYHYAIDACGIPGEEAGRYAFGLWDEMQKRGLGPNLVTYNRIITTLVRTGMLKEAEEKFNEAVNLGYMDLFTNRGRFLDVQDVSIEVAELAVRLAVLDRAKMHAVRTAGKGGFYVLTGPANKNTAVKQQAILRVLKEEFGLKVRVDPAKFGRINIRGAQVQELGRELLEAANKEARF